MCFVSRFVPRKRFKWDKMLVMMDPKVRSVYSYCLTAMRRYLFVIRAARRGGRGGHLIEPSGPPISYCVRSYTPAVVLDSEHIVVYRPDPQDNVGQHNF